MRRKPGRKQRPAGQNAVRRLTAAVLTAVLVLGCTSAVPAVYADEVLTVHTAETAVPEERPSLRIVANNITGKTFAGEKRPDTLELSIKVSAGSSFKSLGVVLEYDYSKLHPIDWSSSPQAIAIPNVDAKSMFLLRSAAGAVDAAENWKKAVMLESKSPDGISAKPALSFRSGNKGYLYLSAESVAPVTLTEDTRVVTVRFGYETGTAPSKDYVTSAIKFSSDSNVTYASPVMGSMFYQTENRETGESRFYYHKPLTRLETGLVVVDDRKDGQLIDQFSGQDPVSKMEYIASGVSAFKIEDVSDFACLTFYDWDDTLLGTRVVRKGKGLKDPNGPDLEAYLALRDTMRVAGTIGQEDEVPDAVLADKGFAPIAPEGNLLYGGIDHETGLTVTAINKAGYTFAGWVDRETGHSTPDGSLDLLENLQIDRSELIDLTGVSRSQVVKAAYDENFDFSKITTALPRRYEIIRSKFRPTSEGLECTFSIRRQPYTRRCQEGALLVRMDLRPKGISQTRVRINIGHKDVETFTILLPYEAPSTYQIDNAVTICAEDISGTNRSASYNMGAEEIKRPL